MKKGEIEDMLRQNPTAPSYSEVDDSFTAGVIQRIVLAENAQGQQRKEFSFMKWIHVIKPLKGMTLGMAITVASTVTVGAAAIGYVWHQSSVQTVDINPNVSTFQAAGCPDFYNIEKDPAALEKANLSQTKKFVLRPDAKQLPIQEQQKIVQAYCEINQLAAYSEANWPTSSQAFNNFSLPITVQDVDEMSVKGVIKDEQSATDKQVTFNFSASTKWLDTGKSIDKASVKKGDVLALVSRLSTENAERSNTSLAFVKLPLKALYYSKESQSKLFALNPCENNLDEYCIKTNAQAGLYPEGTGGAYVRPQKSAALQAKITAIEGNRYMLVSGKGSQLVLNLAGYKTDFDLDLEVGDYIDIRYDTAKALSQESIYSMNVLVYQIDSKFGQIMKYKD